VRILLTGANGQVGWELRRALAPLGEVAPFDRAGLDLADRDQIVRRVREVQPGLIVNAAAYTAVDRAESEPELARAINAVAPGILADEARRIDAVLVHYSTDYVFDGAKAGPYAEDDAPNPLNVYGRTKLEGERAIAASGCRHLTLRTSWIYASRGRNFLLTMLRLAREGRELRVVDDQQGTPTWARDVAEATALLVQRADPATGLYHFTAAGQTTWCGFAREIMATANLATIVHPIATADYPTTAARPRSSVLRNTKIARVAGVRIREWRSGVRACMAEIDPVRGAA
jgi:dTDP-4-dehydrorhamnose reductase